jgi:STE24 endopeptidase
MLSSGFSLVFVFFFLLTLALRYWLARRHIRHVLRHRGAVPAEFAAKIPLAAHQKAADYTVARTRFGWCRPCGAARCWSALRCWADCRPCRPRC